MNKTQRLFLSVPGLAIMALLATGSITKAVAKSCTFDSAFDDSFPKKFSVTIDYQEDGVTVEYMYEPTPIDLGNGEFVNHGISYGLFFPASESDPRDTMRINQALFSDLLGNPGEGREINLQDIHSLAYIDAQCK